MVSGKNPLFSKTLWFAVMVLVVEYLRLHFGIVLSAEVQVAIITIVFVVLRGLTNEPLEWGLIIPKKGRH